MIDLSTRYMGLALKNPLVIASCGLTKTLHGIETCAASGVGAIVLKSMFEEQIKADIAELTSYADDASHTEAYEYLQGYGEAFGPNDYLQLVRDAKQAVDVPIIASVNCVSDNLWADYATQLAAAGADGLEINISFQPKIAELTSSEIEERHEQILETVRRKVKLPIALKLGPYFSSFANLAARLGNNRGEGQPFTVGWCGPAETEQNVTWQGADALVLFNRFYRFDIDVDRLQMTGGNPYSTPDEQHLPLRWISMLAGRVKSDLAASTGIHSGRDVARQLLAGATVVQLCSTLYQHGPEQVGRVLDQLRQWMKEQGFSRLEDFRGRLSQAQSQHPKDYERLQYIKALVDRE